MITQLRSMIERCQAEQRRCRDHIAGGKPDSEGAWLGAGDWLHEEIILTAELRKREEYETFLSQKRILADACGFDVADSDLNPMLFDFQRDIVRWALKRGKAAVFAHTGLGKGPIQLEWARHVAMRTGKRVLILAPLAVSQQFKREAEKFGVPVTVCKSGIETQAGINITNYERIDQFDLSVFAGVALDESSCIKDWTSKTTSKLIELLRNVPYKLCSSATPSPNEHAELGTHAELLDVMERSKMLAMFFEHDGGETSKWALKGHGKKPFWHWLAGFCVCLKKPSDLSPDYDDSRFELPKLNIHEHVVAVDHSIATDGMLFRCPDLSATGLHKELRLTCEDRAKRVAELVAAKPDAPWLLWCNTNYEADAIKAVVPGVEEVRGSDSPEKKERLLNGFSTGEVNRLLSKPEIAGFGLNWQHCGDMAFVGLSYSFEQVFQAIRRCWRFGRTGPVNAHLVCAETEGKVLESLRRKEAQYESMQAEMNEAMRGEQLQARGKRCVVAYDTRMVLPLWL